MWCLRWTFSFLLIFASGCGQSAVRSAFRISNTLERGLPDYKEAGATSFRYAFSGQVLDEGTGNPVKNFSVSLAANEPTVNAILNALGDKNGLFHISRDASLNRSLFESVPALVSAPGFQPLVKELDVGVDCHAVNCASGKPTTLLLKPLGDVTAQLVPDFSPRYLEKEVERRGAPAIFQQLLNTGKLDPRTGGLFARAKTQDSLSNMLVLLNPQGAAQATDLVAGLLAAVEKEKLGALSSPLASADPVSVLASVPKVGSAIVSVGRLLPYLNPILAAMKNRESGVIGQAVVALLRGENAEQNVAALAGALQTKLPRLAMPTIPLGWVGLISKTGAASENPFQGVVASALKDPNFLGLLVTKGAMGAKSVGFELLAIYLKPLLQGLVGKNAPTIALLLNQLLARDGLMAIKEFKTLPDQEKFAALLPYLEPLIRGLNSKDGTFLASQLLPLIEQPNPALVLRELVTKGAGSPEMKAKVATSLFPAVQTLLTQYVPGKQVFAAQLLQGLINGDFKAVSISRDLSGAPAVMLSGQAQDLFKIAQLPNVQKVLWLPQ